MLFEIVDCIIVIKLDVPLWHKCTHKGLLFDLGFSLFPTSCYWMIKFILMFFVLCSTGELPVISLRVELKYPIRLTNYSFNASPSCSFLLFNNFLK